MGSDMEQSELEVILRRIAEIDEAIPGGIMSLFHGENPDVATDMSIIEMAHMVKKIASFAYDDLNSDDIQSLLMRLSAIAKEQNLDIATDVQMLQFAASGSVNKGPVSQSSPQSIENSRRKMFTALAGGLALGCMMKPQPAVALEDSATLASILTFIKDTYKVAKDTMGVMKDVNENINLVNRVMTGSIDGLMGLTQDSTDKEIAATTTGLDRNNETMWSIERTRNELGAQPSSGACNADAAATVAKEMAAKTGAAGTGAAKNYTSKEFVKEARNDGVTEGGNIIDEIKAEKWGALSSGTLNNNYDPKNAESAAARQKVLDRATRAPSAIPKGKLERYAQTPQGKSFVADIATRGVRRSAAIAALNTISEGTRSDVTAYQHIYSQVKSSASTDTSMIKDADEKARIDTKMLAYSSALLKDLEDIRKKEGTPGISYMDLLEFRVRSKDSPSFYEFVRSTGNTEAPLLREIIDQNSISLQLEVEILKQMRDQTVLLSYILLDNQDDPQRVGAIKEAADAAMMRP